MMELQAVACIDLICTFDELYDAEQTKNSYQILHGKEFWFENKIQNGKQITSVFQLFRLWLI